MFICGEPSGDLNAGTLAKAIKMINPRIKISGIGGALLSQSQAEIYCDIKELAVIGLFDVLRKLPKFFILKKLILEKIAREKPDAIILVDFSGFNLRIAKAIRKSIPTIYYVSPQVWASRPGRIKTIKKYIHKMVVLFKFEQEFYKKYGVDVDWSGHPLLDIAVPSANKKDFLLKIGLAEGKTTIALLPGSRKSEIENILPTMLLSCLLIKNKIKDVQFIIAKSPQVEWRIYDRILQGINLDLKIVDGQTYDCINAADFCLVASGTATLETAILERPFVIAYKLGILNYLLYRPQIRLPYIGMVNIVAGRKIIPEFIQFKATPKNISEEVLKILQEPLRLQDMKNDLAQVKSAFGEKGASLRAAKIILDFLNKYQ